MSDLATVLGDQYKTKTISIGGSYTFPTVAHCVVMYSYSNAVVFIILVGGEANLKLSVLNAPEWLDVGTDSGTKTAIELVDGNKIKITQHQNYNLPLYYKILW